jgi:DNA-binding NarL/FixJ family response regulator
MSQLSSRTAVIVDERPLWLNALEGLLGRLELEVVGRATDHSDARSMVIEHAPDILIADYAVISDGESSDTTILHRARQVNPNVKCIVLSESDDPRERQRAFAAGASVCCVKRAQPDDLATAIRQSFERSIYFATGPQISTESTPQPTQPEASAALTKREIEILRLAAEGHSNAQLARMLWVTEQTVKFHLSNLYRKIGVSNRTEASRWAQRHGLLDLETAAA